MNIRKKSLQLLEAQVGDYLGGRTLPRAAAIELGRSVDALLGIDPLELVDRPDIIDPRPLFTTDEVAALSEGYVDNLRQKTPDQRQIVRDKAAYIARYDEFEPAIKRLFEQPSQSRLGGGSYSHVYKLRYHHDEYAVRVPHCLISVEEIDKHLEAAIRVQDLPNIEHIIAASYKDNITVADFVPGSLLYDCSSYILYGIPQEAYDELYQSLYTAQLRGVGFDSRGSNLMYSEHDMSFTMIDVGMADGDLYADAATAIFINIGNAFPGIEYRDELDGEDITIAHTMVDMLQRFRCTLMHFEPDSPVVIRIDSMLQNVQDLLDEASS